MYGLMYFRGMVTYGKLTPISFHISICYVIIISKYLLSINLIIIVTNLLL